MEGPLVICSLTIDLSYLLTLCMLKYQNNISLLRFFFHSPLGDMPPWLVYTRASSLHSLVSTTKIAHPKCMGTKLSMFFVVFVWSLLPTCRVYS